jgi:hypothetical protein
MPIRRPLRLAGFPSNPSMTAAWVRDRSFPEGRRICEGENEREKLSKNDIKYTYFPKACYTHPGGSTARPATSNHNTSRVSRRGHVAEITCMSDHVHVSLLFRVSVASLPHTFREPAYVWLTPYGNQTKDHFMTLGYVLEGNFHCLFDKFLPDRRSFIGTFTF